MEEAMKVTIRYFEGCPNWRTARERLRAAIDRTKADAKVALERVETEAEAECLRFRGSPTILIDGADPFADEAAPFGLSCRVYRTQRGLEGAPSEEQLVAALTRPVP
jgi:hypothetical protein